MKYKAVLFDLDGTLLDTTEGVVAAVRRTIKEQGLKMPDDATLKKFVGPPMQKSMGEEFCLGEEQALALANKFRANYQKYSLFQASPYDGVLELLSRLRADGYQIAVATNKSHQNACDILKRFGIDTFCDYMLGADLEGKLSKEDIINLCMNNLCVEKQDAVLVGDSIYDLAGAEKSGVDFIAVTYGFGFKADEDINNGACVFVANTVNELDRFFV